MISGYAVADGKLRPLANLFAETDSAVWIDILRPTAEEESTLETALGIDIPTPEEMREIEVSSRLYVESDVSYMTALILSHSDGDDVVISPITFALAGARLLTIRHEEPRVFAGFVSRAQKAQVGCVNAESVLIGLLEAIVDRLADVLERVANDIDTLSREIFRERAKPADQARDFQRALVELGRKENVTSKIRDSLVTLERLFGFLNLQADQRAAIAQNGKKVDKDLRARLKTLGRDAHSLSEHVSYISQKTTFLLEATLGLINIEQNAIIKTFSVVAVAFMPPTLIASIYGMNFHFLPELSWPLGYPFAIALMFLSAILPLLFFKRKGWL
ncbi:MAG TPA: magnesium/cobalt transporter CorA [Parvularculaceae bacterium]|nr:magnesium/cobalt transporter CorA [Parvularculaceae bacterium]